jgi:hypothetical protein
MTSRLKSAVKATDAIGQLLQRGMSDIPNLTQWSGFSNAETPPTECGSIRTWRPALRNLKSYRIDHHSSLGLAKLAFPDEIRGPLNLRKRRHVPSGVSQRQDCRPLTPFAQVGSFFCTNQRRPLGRQMSASATAWLIALVQIKSVSLAVIGSGRPGAWNPAVNWRKQSHVSDDCAQILFLKVGELVPRHPLPMELSAIPTNTAANSSLQLPIGPGANARLRMRRYVSCPQGPKRLPANWRAAASVCSMTDGAAC